MKASPNNSRYVPFTQQPNCCVPTCIQMVMYKNGISLLPAEEIGYFLGLVVRPDQSGKFYKVRTSDTSPPAGYGTRIYDPEFEPNVAFKKLKVPLLFSKKSVKQISSAKNLLDNLSKIEAKNGDALLCFNHGALLDNDSMDWGHVCVFDRIIDGQIRIVDPASENPKWRIVTAEKMFEAMQKHGVQKSAGIWFLTKI